MFGIGAQELILLMIGALIIFGPQRLPEIAGQVGKAIRDFRRMSDDLTGEFQRNFTLDEPAPAPTNPALTGEADAASATPNGISDTIAQALRVETIPTDSPPDESAATPDETTAKTEDTVISFAPMATKAEPLVGVSLLDEPTPFTGEKRIVIEDTSTISTESSESQPAVQTESVPLALDAAPAQNGFADAWDAVINTEATVAVAVAAPEAIPAEPEAVLTVPEGYAYPPNTYVAAPLPYVEPVRERIDPDAEVTIREKIENQTAAEAFRERRRLAHYQHARKKD